MNHEQARSLDHDVVDVPKSQLAAPVLTYVGGREWRLEAAYRYRDDSTLIIVPAGFVFDLSSVPRGLWWLIAPFELSIVAPLLHDFLYLHGRAPPPGTIEPPRTYTRAQADHVFLEIMEAEGVSRWRRALGYAAVRVFGRRAWCA